MKSVQLNFFIHPDDLKAIESFLIEKNILFISQPTFDLNDPYTNTIAYPKPENHFDTVYLLHPKFMDNVFFDKIEKQGYYSIKVLPSYVLEFSRGGFSSDAEKLHRARLYFIKYFNDENGIEVTKPDDFVNWANGIVKDFKKFFLTRVDNGRDYLFSQRIISWMKETNAHLDTPGLSLVKIIN
jgi:hypothetical protein